MQAGEHHCPPDKRKYVLGVAFLASAMGFIDSTIVAVALPQIRSSLHAGFAEAQWFSNAYMLTLSAFVLLGGGLGDKLGIRRVLTLGLFGFIAASLACAFAWNSESLILFRTVQGVGAAVMLPGSMSLIARNTPRSERGKAMGIWVSTSAITTALGPFLGGFLLTYGGGEAWRWIFAINLPLGAFALWMLLRHVPDDLPQVKGGLGSLDWTGSVLLTLAMGTLALGLTLFGEQAANPLATGLIVCGIFISALAIWWEARAPNAMIDMNLFRSFGFSGANMITFLIWTCMGAVTFFLPMLVIIAWKLPATYAGSMFVPFSIVIALLSPLVGRYVDRFGTRLFLTMGSLIFGTACLLFVQAINVQDYWTGILPACTVLGIGIALLGASISTAVVNTVAEDRTGAASAINNMMARVSYLFAVAGLGVLVAWVHADVVNQSSLIIEVKDLMNQAGFGERLTGALYQLPVVELQENAMTEAMKALFITLATLSFLAVPIAYFTQKSVASDGE